MDYSKKNTNIAILSVFIATVILICSRQNLSPKFLLVSTKVSPEVSDSKDELQIALEKASMPDKTVIISIINEAYVEPHENEYPTMFDLFLEGFWAGEGVRSLVNHLLVVAMDEKAYQRCEFRRMNCYRLPGGDFAGEKIYMSGEFIEMMWRRTGFLLEVLRRGYSFIFTDADVLWLRNPFTQLSSNQTLDLQISTDNFNGDASSTANPINTGFYLVRSNNRTVSLFQAWQASRSNSSSSRVKEQDVLADMVRRGVLAELGVRTTFLRTRHFSGFCTNSDDVRSVVTVHANCCRTIRAKVADLKTVLADWRRFVQRHPNQNETTAVKNGLFTWSKHEACVRSWAMG